MRPPRVPVRTCVGCRQEAGKGELVRLVRDPATGEVRLDLTGGAPGRGAYLHPNEECVTAARRRGAAGRALKAPVPDSVWEAVQSDAFRESLPLDGRGLPNTNAG